MSEMTEEEKKLLLEQWQQKITEGEDLLQRLRDPGLRGLNGVSKLVKKIQQELKFLKKFDEGGGALKKEHLSCSNLHNLNAVVKVLEEVKSSATQARISSVLYF